MVVPTWPHCPPHPTTRDVVFLLRRWDGFSDRSGKSRGPTGSRYGREDLFLSLVNAFGVDVEGTGSGLRRAAFSG